MDIQQILILLVAFPLVMSAIIWFSPNNFKTLSILHVIGSIIEAILGLKIVTSVVNGSVFFAFNKMIFIDAVGGVILSLIAVTGLLINLYSVKYMQWEIEKNEVTLRDTKLFFALSHLFIFTMVLSTVSNNIAIMWSAIEATTLSSVFMVALYRNKRATESGWKYIVICSIGLAFSLYATVLLYSAGFAVIHDSQSTMLWTNLMAHAKEINPDALKIIFVFALIGFGTKAGLAPTHTWLPDVHSEGPAPASAALSAILLKCAMLGIIRYYAVVGNSMIGFKYVQMLMLVSGLVSIIVAALFVMRQTDIKRMFAYHSIEHIGIIAFGLGIGGPLGIFAALFHTMSHSFTKALAFCVSGNIMKIYGTRDMTKMGGLFKIAPISAILFTIAICSLIGIPLFAIFTSEFLTVKAALFSQQYIAITIFIIGLAIILVGVFDHYNSIMFGKPKGKVESGEVEWSANLPLIGLAILIIIFGIFSINSWMTLLHNATKIIMGI